MTSLIEQLQSHALDNTVPATDLLRKAKVVAVKLDLGEFLVWIEKELNGYETETQDELPRYRMLKGETKAWNPYQGWIPVMFHDEESQDLLSRRGANQPLGELEHIVRTSEDGTLRMSFNTAAKKQIMEAIEYEGDIVFMMSTASVAGIIDAVRNIILDWSLKLEQAGIIGDGMSFSGEDKIKAKEPRATYNINKIENFTGNMGSVSDQATISIQQINSGDIEGIKKVIAQIKDKSNSLGLSGLSQAELSTTAVELEKEIQKTNPKASRIQSLLSSLRAILEGATGNLVAQGILTELLKYST